MLKFHNYIATACFLLLLVPSAQAQILNRSIPAVPASQLPRSFSQRVQTSPVDAALLRQRPSRKYFLDAGDVLGVFIESILGNIDEMPPVQLPDPNSDLPPSIGYPVVVRADGTISLPLVDPIPVRGLTVIQVEELVKSRYRDPDRPILRPENRIMVSLMRKRTVSVYVLRGDAPAAAVSVNRRSDQSRRSDRLRLPAGDNDVLNALSQTGGLPGVNARADVKIYRADGSVTASATRHQIDGNDGRGYSDFPRTSIGGSSYARSSSSAGCWDRSVRPSAYSAGGTTITTVATRRQAGENTYVGPNDARLNNGDVVVIEPRDTEVYYTGGLLGGGQFPIPRDRGLDVLEAIALAGQSLGAAAQNGFSVVPRRSPTELLILRQRPGQGQLAIRVDVDGALTDPSQRIQVQAGDLLILRHSRREQIQNAGIGIINAYGVRQFLGR